MATAISDRVRAMLSVPKRDSYRLLKAQKRREARNAKRRAIAQRNGR